MKKKVIMALIAVVVLAGLSFGAFKGVGMVKAYTGTYKAFKAGEEAMQKKDYAGAIENYEKIYAGGYQYEEAQKKLPELKKEYCKEMCSKAMDCIILGDEISDVNEALDRANKIEEYISMTNKYIEFADEETKSEIDMLKGWAKWKKKDKYANIDCIYKGKYKYFYIDNAFLGFNITNNSDKDIKEIGFRLIAKNHSTDMQYCALIQFKEEELKKDKKIMYGSDIQGDGCILSGENCTVSYTITPSVWDSNSFWFIDEEYDVTNFDNDALQIYTDIFHIKYTDDEEISLEGIPAYIF